MCPRLMCLMCPRFMCLMCPQCVLNVFSNCPRCVLNMSSICPETFAFYPDQHHILGEWEAVEEHLQIVADEVVFSYSIRLRAPSTSHEESAGIATNSCYLDKEKYTALYEPISMESVTSTSLVVNRNNVECADPELWRSSSHDIDSTESESEQDTISIESMDLISMLIDDYSTISDITELQCKGSTVCGKCR